MDGEDRIEKAILGTCKKLGDKAGGKGSDKTLVYFALCVQAGRELGSNKLTSLPSGFFDNHGSLTRL